MKKIEFAEFQKGRVFAGRIPGGQDILTAVKTFCRDHAIEMATLSVSGCVSSIALGTYDLTQQVYVTVKERGSFEILNCTGCISPKDGKPFVSVTAILANENGRIMGGRLFSGTTIFAGEFLVQEFTGNVPQRKYDKDSGMDLWQFKS